MSYAAPPPYTLAGDAMVEEGSKREVLLESEEDDVAQQSHLQSETSLKIRTDAEASDFCPAIANYTEYFGL